MMPSAPRVHTQDKNLTKLNTFIIRRHYTYLNLCSDVRFNESRFSDLSMPQEEHVAGN